MRPKIGSLWTVAKAKCQLLISFVPQFWSDLSPDSLKLSGLNLLWDDYHRIYLLWRDPTFSVESVSGLISYWLENIWNAPCIVLFKDNWLLDPCKGTLGRMLVCLLCFASDFHSFSVIPQQWGFFWWRQSHNTLEYPETLNNNAVRKKKKRTLFIIELIETSTLHGRVRKEEKQRNDISDRCRIKRGIPDILELF